MAGATERNDSSTRYVPSRIKVHKFVDEIVGKKILFQVVKMNDTVMIYVNEKDRLCCNDLVLSLKTPYGVVPQSTALLGEGRSANVSSRLAKKLNRAVYLSLNVEDRLMLPLVEKRLLQEMTASPEKF